MGEVIVGLLVLAGVAVVLGLFAIWMLGVRTRIVPEEERLVIYRMGKFHRIAGPGLVWTMGGDTVEHVINVRDRPRNIRVDNLFMFDLPFGYTVNFWYRFDPVQAAGRNQEQLVHLAQFTDQEREGLVKDKVRDALLHAAKYIERNYQAAGNEFFYKLLPVLPGLPDGDDLLGYAKEELSRTLPSIGVILNRSHPLSASALHLSDDVSKSFSRGRVVQMLKEQFPDLSQDVIMQYVSAVEKIGGTHQRLVLENNNPMDTAVDMRVEEDGAKPRVKTYQRPSGTNGATAGKSGKTTPPPPEQETLTAADWAVLKSVPMARGRGRSIA